MLPATGCAGSVKVGIEAAVIITGRCSPRGLAPGWEVLELNPAHVTEQRRVQGRRRVKTDAIDLEAITELVLAGRGVPVTAREQVIGELAAWVDAPDSAGRDPDRDEEPTAGPARPLLSGADLGVA